MTFRPAPARTSALRLAAAVTAAASALLLGGCSTLSPVQTADNVQTANGVAVDLGAVQIRDLVVIAQSEGGPGVLIGQIVNNGTASATVSFAATSGTASSSDIVSTDVPPHDSTTLSTASAHITLPAVPAAPGAILQLQVHTPDAGVNIVGVPVLLPTGYYSSESP